MHPLTLAEVNPCQMGVARLGLPSAPLYVLQGTPPERYLLNL